MAKFTIQPHGRLQEWIAHQNGFFVAEGLDYEFGAPSFADEQKPLEPAQEITDVRRGAFEAYREGGGHKGSKSNISCACHWAVGQAAADQVGVLWSRSYVVTPGGVMVPPESPIVSLEQLAGQEIAVGYHSGSHFATVQALEPFLDRAQIELRFVGAPWARVDLAMHRGIAASSVWGLTFQTLEQLGFRKIADTSFMITFMFPKETDSLDVEKYMNGLRRAQMELDLAPERYKTLYLNELPARYRGLVDVRRFSTGERVVFLPYTDETHRKTRAWVRDRGIFEDPLALA